MKEKLVYKSEYESSYTILLCLVVYDIVMSLIVMMIPTPKINLVNISMTERSTIPMNIV